MNMTLRRWIGLCLLCAIALSACDSSGKTGSASASIENYLNALIAKDTNRLVAASCADWEEQARQEIESFAAVTAQLDQLQCKDTGQEGEFTLVSCSGKIVASYNGEDQEIDLAQRVFRARQEGGEWRMCGYH